MYCQGETQWTFYKNPLQNFPEAFQVQKRYRYSHQQQPGRWMVQKVHLKFEAANSNKWNLAIHRQEGFQRKSHHQPIVWQSVELDCISSWCGFLPASCELIFNKWIELRIDNQKFKIYFSFFCEHFVTIQFSKPKQFQFLWQPTQTDSTLPHNLWQSSFEKDFVTTKLEFKKRQYIIIDSSLKLLTMNFSFSLPVP